MVKLENNKLFINGTCIPFHRFHFDNDGNISIILSKSKDLEFFLLRFLPKQIEVSLHYRQISMSFYNWRDVEFSWLGERILSITAFNEDWDFDPSEFGFVHDEHGRYVHLSPENVY